MSMAHQTNSQLQKVIRKQKQTFVFVFALKHIEIMKNKIQCAGPTNLFNTNLNNTICGRKCHAHRSVLVTYQQTKT